MGHPSHKIIFLVVLAILLVGGAFLLAEYNNKNTEKISYISEIVSTTTPNLYPEITNEDSDNDGLKDWEEILLGTDPRKADTDGDGTSDGKESELGRNPLVKGPNDKAEAVSSKIKQGEGLTPLDVAARSFFARYMELRQAGLSGDIQSQNEIIGDYLENGIILDTPKVYTSTALKIRNDDSKTSIEKYGNEVLGVFSKNYIETRNEAIIAKDFAEKGDPNILKEIDPIILNYKTIIASLLEVEVPKSLTKIHLEIINGMSSALLIAESFRKSDKDPLMGLQGTAGYLESARKIFNAFRTLQEIAYGLGIKYENELGEIPSF